MQIYTNFLAAHQENVNHLKIYL